MKRMLTACLLGPIVLTAAFAALAQNAVSTDAKAKAEVDVDVQAREGARAVGAEQLAQEDAKASVEEDVDRQCIRYTGTHIKSTRIKTSDLDEEDCVRANGRVYTRDELRSTGRVDMADALRALDPAIY